MADFAMQIFLETERLVLRWFTEDDVDNLVELDGDPDVMRFINGGRPTPRHEIETDVLPNFLGYYERFAGYGFWAAVEKSPACPRMPGRGYGSSRAVAAAGGAIPITT